MRSGIMTVVVVVVVVIVVVVDVVAVDDDVVVLVLSTLLLLILMLLLLMLLRVRLHIQMLHGAVDAIECSCSMKQMHFFYYLGSIVMPGRRHNRCVICCGHCIESLFPSDPNDISKLAIHGVFMVGNEVVAERGWGEERGSVGWLPL